MSREIDVVTLTEAEYDELVAKCDGLQKELAAADARYSRLAGWCGDECDRRKAAEAVLRELENDDGVGDLIDAHFARYKEG